MVEAGNSKVREQPAGNEARTRRWLLGFFLFPIALFPLLSLMSYRWQAIPTLNIPPETSTNLIGVVGDTFAYYGYQLIGLAIWAVPPLTILLGLLDTFNMIFGDILEAAQPFAEGFTSTVLPVLTEFGTQALGTLTLVFGEVKDIFDSVWSEGIAPFFKRIGKYWNEAWESVKTVWEAHGQPIFDGINKAFKNIGDILKNVWELFLKPVWDNFMQSLD